MAVVTEPPWVNQTSGIAARNGTTSHTIPFGFTPASGNELVFVAFGAVTHAAGWTERLQPVSTAELSVFTKTAAGDTSITVAHNGSDYPVCWVAYELPAGSAWVDGTGASPTSDTFPALSGLPGVEVVVFGAQGRTPNATDVTSGSAVWSSPWAEDGDLFAAHNGATQGAYLTAGHQINYTGTSMTPSAAMTYSGGDWSTDRQHVVFAFNVASVVGTTHTATASGAASSTGSAAAAVQSGPITWGASAAGASTSTGASAVTATFRVTAAGSSTTAGTATPGALLQALAAAAATSAGQALAQIIGQSVKATSTPTVSGGTSTPTVAAATSVPALTARRTSTSEVTHG